MARRSLPLRFGLSLVCLALGASFGLGPASAEIVRARYSVSLIGLHIGEAQAVGKFEPASYKIDLNAKLTGLAAMISNVRMAFTSTGLLRRGSIAPTTYATTAANSHDTRTVRMALNAGSVRAVDISPPFEDWQVRVPVTEAHKRNILDPTSALIMSVPEGEPLVGPAACNRTLPIYDGYTRFDVALSYVGTRNVAAKGYSGPVSVCAARYRPVAGHRPDARSTQFMANNQQIEAWLAPVEHAHVVVPFRVALMTMAGLAEIDAVEFSVEPSPVTANTR